MSVPSHGKSRALLFFCMRQNPDKLPGLRESVIGNFEITKIEVPCSGRAGTGDLMQGLASGYEKVIVMSCGEKSCIHQFGCVEAKNAMERAKKLAKIAGVDTKRLIFIETDNVG